MPGKRVHLDYYTSATTSATAPSPTFSLPSLPSTEPITPPPLNYGLPYGRPSHTSSSLLEHPSIHPLLDAANARKSFTYILSKASAAAELLATMSSNVQAQPATIPPVSCMEICSVLLPWRITIRPLQTPYVTFGDVISGLYRSLWMSVTESEYRALLSTKTQADVRYAYQLRCKTEEERKGGLKRVDFLLKRPVFVGIVPPTDDRQIWRLETGSGPHLDRYASFSSLAHSLPKSVEQLDQQSDLEDAILDRATLELERRLSREHNHDKIDMAVCWISAEHALKHIELNRPQIDTTFSNHNIEISQFAVCAGFDESLIRKGTYLEQVHIFTSSSIIPTSSLLTKLGHILSPFSSLLFTESSCFELPLIKSDGSTWEFDELVLETASKHMDHGSTAAMYPTVITLSQTSELSDTTDSPSQQDSGSRKQKDIGKEDSTESGGGGGERGDENSGNDRGDDSENRNRSPGNPYNSKTVGKGKVKEIRKTHGTVAFQVVANIYSTEDISSTIRKSSTEGESLAETSRPPVPFQFISTESELKIQMDENENSPKCEVQFTNLKFGSDDSLTRPELAYRQFHFRVAIDSLRESRITVIQPQQSLAFEKETTVTDSSNTTRTQTYAANANLTVGRMIPSLAIGGSATHARANQEGTASARKSFTSRIKQTDRSGAVWWDFYVEDPYEQEGGMKVLDTKLPFAKFQFRVGGSNNRTVPIPDIPEHINVEIDSYWSIIPSHTFAVESGFFSKILPQLASRYTSGTQYSNLCQIVALKICSDLDHASDYCAEVDVKVQTKGRSMEFKDPTVLYPGSKAVEVRPNVTGKTLQESVYLPSLKQNLVCSNSLFIGSPPKRRSDQNPSSNEE